MTHRTRRLTCITAVTALATLAVGLLMALLWFDASDVSLAQEGPAHTVVPGDIYPQATEDVSGTITIQKVTVPSDSSPEFTFAATYSATGFTLSDGASSTSGPLDEDTYAVTETLPAGWDLSGISCQGGLTSTWVVNLSTRSVEIALAEGEDVTCVFTNTQLASLEVEKILVGQAPSSAWGFTGDLGSFSIPATGGTETFSPSAGTYTISETIKAGYDVAVSCDSGESGSDSVTLDLAAGEDVACTFTNTQQTSLDVQKVVVGQVPGSAWGFTGDLGSFSIPAIGGTETFSPSAGTYTISETIKAGYDVAVSCDSGESGSDGVTVDLTLGEDVRCVFTNTRQTGQLTVTKDVDPDAADTNWDIEVTGPSSFTDTLSGDDTTGLRVVWTGLYTITETAGTGADLDDYDTTYICSGDVASSGTGTSISVEIGEDQAITCTFTNTRKTGQLEVVKELVPDTDPGRFALWIDDRIEKSEATHGDTTGKKTVTTGQHSVRETEGSETFLPDYDSFISCVDADGVQVAASDDTGPLPVTVTEDDDIVCTITNTRKTGELTVMKDVVPDDPNTNWEIEVDGSTYFIQPISGDGTTGPRSVNTGLYTIREAAGSGTSLDDYNTTWACSDGREDTGDRIILDVDQNEAITCIFTNTRKMGQLEVVKALEPSTDPGRFNLQIDGTDISVNVADGGTTGKKSVSTDVHIVGETAGTNTDLDDYDTAISCVDQGGLGKVVASATAVSLSVTVEDGDDIVCTIANEAHADLTIAKTDEPSTVDAGDVLNYTILVTNNGPASAQNVVVKDFLPSGVTYQDDTDACREDLPGILTCRLGMLEATGTASFGVEVVVGPDAGNSITNTVTVTSATHDPVPDNNEASEATLVEFNPAIKLQKSGPVSSTVGSNVLYQFSASNDDVAGDGSPIINPTVSDNIAGPCTLQYNGDGDNILELGETWFFTARYKVQLGDAGKALVNEATAQGTDLDGDPVTVTDTHTMAIEFTPGVEIQKIAPPTSAMGALVTYTVSITNTSTPENAPELVLERLLDDRAGDLTTSARDGDCDTLSSGETCTFAYTYTVQDGDPDPLISTAEVHYEPRDVTLTITDVASHTLDLFYPLLQVVKAGPEQSEFGDVVSYTVTIANDSSSDTPFLSLVNIADSLKGDLTSPDNVVSSTCTDGLGIGDQCQIIYTYTVQADDSRPLVNTVSVESQAAGFASLVTASAVHSMGVTSYVHLPGIVKNYPPAWKKSVGLPAGVRVRTLAVCPSNPDVLYAGVFARSGLEWSGLGVYKSTDAGHSWDPTGLRSGKVYGIAVAPGSCKTVYAAAWTAGLLTSVNGGNDWSSAWGDLGAYAYSVVIDPLNANVLYVGTPDQGVYRSLNAGEDWSQWGLYSPSAVVDLSFTPGYQALYAAKYGEGVYKRVRVGTNWNDWQPVNNGIESAHRRIFSVSIDQQSPSTVFAASYSGGIYRTRNGGGSWAPVLPLSGAYDVLVDPGNGDVVYAGTEDGVYRSNTGGDRGDWDEWNTGLGNLLSRALAIGPDSAEYIHVGTDDGAWRRPR